MKLYFKSGTALSHPNLSVEIQKSFSDECMYVCMYVHNRFTVDRSTQVNFTLYYNDGDNLGGPVTKTVNLLYGKENKQDDK